MKVMSFVVPALLVAGVSAAQARDIYCFNRGGTLPAGAEYTQDWIVTNEKARKPQMWMGRLQQKPPSERPKNGEFKATHYALSYRSTKSGEDRISIRWHRGDPTGKPVSSIIHLRIKVVDGPI